MMTFQLEFETREEMFEAIEILKKEYGFTGELSHRQMENGTWRVSVLSEKRFRETTLEKMPGRTITDS